MSIDTKHMTLTVGGHEVQAYSARPADPNAPGVVVIHEAWGVDQHIRGLVDRFAEAGFAAIAPNLLGMEVTIKPETFLAGYMALQKIPPEERAVPARVDEAIADMPAEHREQFKQLSAILMRGATPEGRSAITACIEHLKAQGAAKVGLTGYCLGGAYTWSYAFNGGQADAFAPFYGRLPESYDAGQVKAPLEGHFGAEDHGIPTAPIQEAVDKIKAAGQHAELFVYPGAPHAFMNETRDTYHAPSAELAWERLVAFFNKTLR